MYGTAILVVGSLLNVGVYVAGSLYKKWRIDQQHTQIGEYDFSDEFRKSEKQEAGHVLPVVDYTADSVRLIQKRK